MTKTYAMKYLGYPRTPTDAKYQTEMPDGSLWQVPVQVIVDSRDEHYAENKEDTVGFIRAGSLAEYAVECWAETCMDWSSVKNYAVKVEAKAKSIDWEEGWCNGEHEVVGKI